MSSIMEVSDSDFEGQVLNSETPVLVDFWAPWCGPCLSITPVLEEVAQEFQGRLKVVKVNVDDNREAATKYNVMSIPNLIFFKGGESQEQIRGVVAKQDLMDAIQKVL